MIPKEAVEAAKAAIRKESMKIHGWGESENAVTQAALEAAAPFLRAQALEDAADELDRLKAIGRKPHRECSHDELAEYYPFVESKHEQWLRARAATEREQA